MKKKTLSKTALWITKTALDYEKWKYFENLISLSILLLYFVCFTHLKENKSSDLTSYFS